ncbi:helix-turn-helix domain-containing protein [Gemmata massiliana]|uniref:helix-turn-helix domain-containing protein n=1 Tax=Gemmata massiliana TaxID=1210884 RepID=UPI0013A6BF05|nr:helix-turn-helix domain-containing protein [Gemmata massiliana]
MAKRLNISVSFVYTAVADGRLKHQGRGQGGIRVSEQQLAAYLADTERGGKSEEAPKRRYKHLT